VLAFTARVFLRQKAEAQKCRRPLSDFIDDVRAVPGQGSLRPTADDQAQATLFGKIFKEEISGVEVLHSASARARHLNRHGALGVTAPALKNWLDRWMRGGGIAVR
jgi:hypothetical protein